jgi:hypothetical protein
MARPTITDDLLTGIIGAKVKAAVSTAQLCRLIEEFVPQQHGRAARRDIDGDLQIKKIPQHRRAEFLAALSLLSGAEAKGWLLKAFAERLGIARVTARNQLKAAFSNTDTPLASLTAS